MRRISNLQIAYCGEDCDPRDYQRICAELVGDGFVPYGQPYTNAGVVFREFVQWEYEDGVVDPSFEWQDDEEIEPQTPFERHDFFEGIDTE